MRAISNLAAAVMAMGLLTAPAVAAEQDATAPAAAAAAPAAAPAADKLICRRTAETGSLVKTKKACHTKSQWAYIDERNQQLSRQMVEDGTTRQGGSN
jgi:predicted transglutaminase-like cysteine proteinase